MTLRETNKKAWKRKLDRAVSEKRSVKVVLAEIKKCDVLCANCHAKEHYENR